MATDPEPLANALGVPTLLYLSKVLERHPVQAEAVPAEASDTLRRVAALEPDQLAAAESVCAVAAALVPTSSAAQVTEEMFDLEVTAAARPAASTPAPAPAPAAPGPNGPQLRAFRGAADLLQCLVQMGRAQSGSLYRRILAHEGLDAARWHDVVTRVTQDASRVQALSPSATLVVFVDELNTAGALGAITEVFTNHRHNGRPLPANILFAGAINPRRESPQPATPMPEAPTRTDAGAADVGARPARQASAAPASAPSSAPSAPEAASARSGEPAGWARGGQPEAMLDYLALTPFIVRPLPLSLESRVSPHGGMAGAPERIFLSACASSRRISGSQSPPVVVLDLIQCAQEAVRRYSLPRISVSIRDLLRALRVFAWLVDQWLPTRRDLRTHEPVEASFTNPFLPVSATGWPRQHQTGRAAIMAVALTYWARLPSSAHAATGVASDLRADLASKLVPYVRQLVAGGFLPTGTSFTATVVAGFDHLWSHAHKPEGIAATAGLKEAFWAVVVCAHTKLPLLLTGPPGCGKTLSFQLASLNLKGQDAPSEVFKALKHIVGEPYQCSEASTATEIADVFRRAVARQRNADQWTPGVYTVAVSLDEAGLPPERRQALKSAHDPLDLHEVAVAFMSNTTLDEAKTSRMIQVLQSQASTEDREALAVGLLLGQDAAGVAGMAARRRDRMRARIRGLVRAFAELRAPVPSKAWYDSRDFVFVCK